MCIVCVRTVSVKVELASCVLRWKDAEGVDIPGSRICAVGQRRCVCNAGALAEGGAVLGSERESGGGGWSLCGLRDGEMGRGGYGVPESGRESVCVEERGEREEKWMRDD